MNILVISTVAYSPNGITAVIRNLYANRMFADDKVAFLFPLGGDEDLFRELRELGYSVQSGSGRNSNPVKYLRYLKQQMRKHDAQMVHIHCNSATCLAELLAAKLAGVPYRIVHAHSCSSSYPMIHNLLKPAVGALATERFACSREAGSFLFGNKAVTVVANAIDVDAYRYNAQVRREYRHRYGLEEKFVLGHVGTFRKLKNQVFLLDVLQELKRTREDAILVLVGDGPEMDAVRAKAETLGLSDSVIFTGPMPDVSGILNMMDCFVFPSLSEGFGIAPVEAQANGLPVIASEGRLPDAVKINDNFRFAALEKGAAYWSEEILTVELRRQEGAAEIVKQAGHDRMATVVQLRERMRQMLKE